MLLAYSSSHLILPNTSYFLLLTSYFLLPSLDGYGFPLQFSLGWFKGCEADPSPNLQRLVHALRCEISAAQLGVVGGFTLHRIVPGNQSDPAGGAVRLMYKNRQGEEIEFGFGMWVDRHKWEKREHLQALAEVCTQPSTLHYHPFHCLPLRMALGPRYVHRWRRCMQRSSKCTSSTHQFSWRRRPSHQRSTPFPLSCCAAAD